MPDNRFVLINRKDMSNLVYAMRLIIEWRTLHETCLNRSSCIGCPYWNSHTCTKKSTEQIIEHASEIFEEYIEERAGN